MQLIFMLLLRFMRCVWSGPLVDIGMSNCANSRERDQVTWLMCWRKFIICLNGILQEMWKLLTKCCPFLCVNRDICCCCWIWHAREPYEVFKNINISSQQQNCYTNSWILFPFYLQNGFVECEQENCPAVDDCYMLEKKNGCCEKCKGNYLTIDFVLDFIMLFNADW